MPDAHTAISQAPSSRPLSTKDRHTWLRTLERGLLFLVLAILAEAVGAAHEERVAIVGQRNPSATAQPTPRASLAHGRVISAAARPATPS